MKTSPIGPFAGLSNRRPDHALFSEDRGFFLAVAENVDLTKAGDLVVRKIPDLIQAMTAPHSLFDGLMVRESSLYAVTLPSYAETFKRLLSSNSPMSYAAINGSTYFSNGTDSGWVDSDGTVRPLGLPTPASPTVTGISGTLFAGKYQVCISYANSTTGEEGGISPSTMQELATNGALRIALPGATDGATHVKVYVSPINGGVPLLQTTVEASTTSVDLTSFSFSGRESAQRIEAPLPAGSRIFEFNGRLCSANGNDLFIGLPYRHGYYLPLSGRIHFPAPISVAIGNQSGIFVAADKTYFIAGGDPSNAEGLRDVLPYGAIPGTEFVLPHKENIVVGWMSTKGFVLAGSDGSVSAVSADEVDVVLPVRGVSAVIENDGRRRVYSCGYVLHLDAGNAVTTYSDDYAITSVSGSYATMVDGVYSLDSDNSADWRISLGRHNFGSELLNSMPAAYVGSAGDRPIQMRVTSRQGTFGYKARTKSSNIQQHRIDPGKGLRDNWFEIELFNTGSDDRIATVSFATPASTRRI